MGENFKGFWNRIVWGMGEGGVRIFGKWIFDLRVGEGKESFW